MILIREDHEATRYAQPGDGTGQSETDQELSGDSGNVLLKSVERANAICLRQAVVLASVDDEHRGRPVLDEVQWVVPTPCKVENLMKEIIE